MAERILTLRELNRATLARQFLLERAHVRPLDAIKQLVAMQGQVSNAPYIGLWARLSAFQRADLTTLLTGRQVVRASSLRGTLHIIAADDYLLLHPLLQPALSRRLHLFAERTVTFDMDHFVTQMRDYVQEQPRTGIELRARLEELYPGMGQQQIVDSVRMYLALLQPIPAGVWGFTGRPTHTDAATWFGQPLTSATEGNLRQLVLRYLAAFGPASVQDAQEWSGLTRLKDVFDEARPDLRIFRDDLGRELFDLPGAPRPDANTPAPVRFLPDFDNLLFAHADRRRVISDADRVRFFAGNSRCTAFLVDGVVRGRWKVERRATSAMLVVESFEPLSPAVEDELRAEGERLLRWMTEDAVVYVVQFTRMAPSL